MDHPRQPRRNVHLLQLLFVAALGVGLLFAVVHTPVARAATINVNTTTDEINADGDCSLREAIRAANLDQAVDACAAGSGADTLRLPAGIYALTIAGIGEDQALTGDLDITGDLTIIGAGRASTTIDASGIDRVFQIDTAINGASAVQIAEVTIRGGDAGAAAGGGILVYAVASALTLTNSRVTNTTGSAGVWVNSGSITLNDARIDNNTGGGVHVGTGTATISSSTIANNTNDGSGGGISSNGTLTVVNSTISGNSAAFHGGGIFSSGTASLYSVTIASNTADSDGSNGDGGGVYVNAIATGELTARNSIIAGNSDGSGVGLQHLDCSGELTSAGYNLIEDTTGCVITGDTTGQLTGVGANLGPLQNNGGRTLTHALLAGSPAINGGAPIRQCVDQDSNPLTLDQRGYLRNALCDIGAYEYDSVGPPTPTATRTPTRTSTATPTHTATRTPSPTQTATPGPSPTASPNPTPGSNDEPTAVPGQERIYLAIVQA
jgi:CSLREA domain-containing protein